MSIPGTVAVATALAINRNSLMSNNRKTSNKTTTFSSGGGKAPKKAVSKNKNK